MEYVVTGGAGFIGNNIVRQLIKNNHSVKVIDNLHSGRKSNLEDILDKIEFHEIDIRNFDKLREICKNVDGIFHEAALTVVQESFTKRDEYFDVNLVGTENILKIAKEFEIKVVFASSSSVYGDTETIPIKEDSPRKPINPYGDTKYQSELLAEKYAELDVKVIGLRYFNIYGKGQTISYAGVITKFLHNIKNNESLKIFGDGEQIRDFVHVEDVAYANILAMDSDVNFGFYNIGTNVPTSINHLAEILITISNQDLKIIHIDALEGDVKNSLADLTNTNKKLNWKAKIGLEEGLKIFFN
ncbi:NAD-dependent epimerase [Nitrosopumilus cobalaminigenes]|uniref:NAD-dependent epimerase n=1 Tax=Nitrosopumilus cobalaminigenes TaxID=1470066 RepID=A0A7D5LYD1_9ARCH|nr:NAD-dependent epimerase/dehydratase family protein [Nitrosopumilus cobalaminigenes]QLH02194.1 NAD-dependent epimerase [Nitrosopumilus cobalaminigenes]